MKSSDTLDARGHVILAVSEVHYEIEGVPDEIERRSYTYNRRGDVVSSTAEFVNSDGSAAGGTRTSYHYDAHGNLVRTVESDFNADGTIDAIRTTTRTWIRASAAR